MVGCCRAWGEPTTGLPGQLTTKGPYRITRNPQYLGDILIVLEFMISGDSPLVLWPAAPTVAIGIAAASAEEPWLRRRYSPAYDAYMARTPRFFALF